MRAPAILAFGAIALTTMCGMTLGADPVVRIHTIDGVQREYLVYVPDGVPEGPRPLVVVFHGGGGSPRNMMDDTTEGQWNRLADQEGFLVAYPKGERRQWNDGRGDDPREGNVLDDVGFVDAIIEDIAGAHELDRTRIYATGHSNGGMMSLRLAQERSGTFAAVCSCTGALPAVNECEGPAVPISVMYMAGTADPLVPFEGGVVGQGADGARRN